MYACAAVLLSAAIYAIIKCVPRARAAILKAAQSCPFLNGLFTSYGFRTVIFFAASMTINIAFALFNAAMSIVTLSVWYGITAAYYICLSALRGAVLYGRHRIKRLDRPNERDELKLFGACGAALFALEVALGAAVTLMVTSDRPTKYSPVMAIGCAAYTFIKIIFAIVNVRKVHKMHDPVLQSLRNINLTDAAVSLLSLQVTMVAVFSDDRSEIMNILNAVTGFVVCALTIFIGIYMMASARRRLKALKE